IDLEKESVMVCNGIKGYAKILTYKNTEPRFEITKEQILELSEKFGRDDSCLSKHFLTEHLERMFPEVFETVLEVGKWYISELGNIVLFKGKAELIPVIVNKSWTKNAIDYSCLKNNPKWKEATAEEVTEALKNEAVKRGFKNSTYFLDTNNETYFIDGDKFSFDLKENKLYIDGWEIFCDGEWAEIIPTKTIQEAEELLKELGHNFKIV
ncbi:hypothetical protein, partial [uncultured Empedobacter sp.]|uniref:hypothetical protein n=1 Tax=uncultured Empedobacter sp. TaxID=410844 RepID=UPI0025F90FE3